MDSITQGLLGAVTVQLGFRQRIGRETTWVAAAVAVIPDLDILIHPLLSLSGAESGELDHIVTHRGISHSLLLVPLMALPIALLWRWAKNNKRRSAEQKTDKPIVSPSPGANCSFLLLYGCTFLALLSHPLLDWCTSYGTQLFAPLTSRRFAIDAIAIIDVFYTPILIFTILACYLIRKIRADSRKLTLWIGWIGFLLSAAYIFTGWQFHNQAIRQVRKHFVRQQGNCPSTQYRAYPQLGCIWLWRVTEQRQNQWIDAQCNLLFDPYLQQVKWTSGSVSDNPWVQIARQLAAVQTFYWFAMDQIRPEYDRQPNRHIVDFHDMRYSPDPAGLESLWSLRVVFDDDGNLVLVDQVRHHPRRDYSSILQQAWRNIWNS